MKAMTEFTPSLQQWLAAAVAGGMISLAACMRPLLAEQEETEKISIRIWNRYNRAALACIVLFMGLEAVRDSHPFHWWRMGLALLAVTLLGRKLIVDRKLLREVGFANAEANMRNHREVEWLSIAVLALVMVMYLIT
jgi:hypothetical protein